MKRGGGKKREEQGRRGKKRGRGRKKETAWREGGKKKMSGALRSSFVTKVIVRVFDFI